MEKKWREGMRPHLVIGGDRDGSVVQWNGATSTTMGFNYTIPGVMTLRPLYLIADRLEPISIDEANRRHEEFVAEIRKQREEQA